MADKAHKMTDKKIEEMERHLSAVYSRANKEVEKTSKEYFAQFKKTDAAKKKLVDDGKLTEKEYKKWRKAEMMKGERFKDLQKNISKQMLEVNRTATAYVNGQLPEVYALNYNALEADLNEIKGYSFTLTDADTVRNLANEEQNFLPYKEVDGVKDIRWNTRQVNAEVLQGIIQGDSVPKIAERLGNNVGMKNYNSAIRNARTTVTSAENKGRFDSYERAINDGVIMKKKWISAIDGRTRDSHRDVNGDVVDYDQPFSNGLMYPGDPNGRPEEIYNCRCTVVAVVTGFKKQAVSVAEETPTAKTEFIEAKTLTEAENYIKKYVNDKQFGALGVSYKGVDVNVANLVNKTISNFYETFDVDMFGGIVAPAGNTKMGKLIDNATAAYSQVRKSFLLNRQSMKNMKVANASFKAEKEALQNLLEHPENYDFSKISKSTLDVIDRAKVSGRATVPDDITDVINHELGHSLESKVYKSELWPEAEKNIAEYADKISGYAGTNRNEYIAESFASYMKGEKVCEPTLMKIFESLKR